MILFSLRTPYMHTRATQTVDRGHVRAAPVICQLITRLSTASLCKETIRLREGGPAQTPFLDFAFPSSSERIYVSRSRQVSRQCQGLLPLCRTCLMTQSQPVHLLGSRPLPGDPSPMPRHWPKSLGVESRNKVVTVLRGASGH